MRMKLVAMLVGIFTISSITVTAQPMTEEEKEKIYNETMALAQPGPEHEIISNLAGEWIMEGQMWMQPGAEAMAFAGTSHSKMVLGGRFLLTEAETNVMGMSSDQIGYIGYDRRHNKFNTVGMDTWGTYWVTASGDYNEKTKIITMYGEDEDPVGGFTQKYDFIWYLVSKDEFRFELVFYNPELTGGAKSHKMIDITYTRVK